MTNILQNGLFGYSKKSVSQYIAGLNEEFTQELLKKETAYRESIQQLQEQLEQLKKENEQLRAGRQEIAGVLLDARAFASELMEKAEAESNAQREKNTAYHQAELQRLNELAENINTLRNACRRTIVQMDEELERYRLKCQTELAVLNEGVLEPPAGETAENEHEAE